MARPKKDSEAAPAKERIELAFWDLIKKYPIQEITVNMIVAQANCSRGSFYYHFEDTSNLVDHLLDKYFPYLLPQAMYAWFSQSLDSLPYLETEPSIQEKLNKMTHLVGPHSSLEVVSKFKNKFVCAWLELFGLTQEDLSHEARILFEFLSNGVTGLISYSAYHGVDLSIEQGMKALYPEIPEAIMKKFSYLIDSPLAPLKPIVP